MYSFRLFLLLALLISLTQGWLFKSRPRCISKKTCMTCTSHKSWFGSRCRWCPRDSKCHEHGAVLTNPCSRSENIVNKASCSNIIRDRYDPNLAYKMVLLSALAYADNVGKFVAKATEVNTFRLAKQVTKFCPGGNARCSGFVAVSSTERAIAIAFRGSENYNQVGYQAIQILTTPKVSFQAGGKVQRYFKNAFLRVWEDLKTEVYQQIKNYPSYKIWVTGHSLGGALASLASTMIAYEGITTKNNLMLYTFGQPRVGNYDYALAHDRWVPISFRVTHYRDPVVHLPMCKKLAPATFCLAPFGGPYHHGKEIYYGQQHMTKSSSYKECNGLPHNEDLSCSNKLSAWSKCLTEKCVDDHNNYFLVDVGVWWKANRG